MSSPPQLVRRVTRHLFQVLHQNDWTPELLKELRKQITETVFKEGTLSFGCTMHFLGLFWEEVAKVSEGKVNSRVATGLIRPFLSFLASTHDHRLSKRVVVDIFYGLLKQSDLARQYNEKYEVWKQFGFPSERIDDLELVEEEENGEGEEDGEMETETTEDDGEVKEQIGLDPRAGNVSVVLHELPFNAKKIHQLMEKTIYDAGTKSTNRKVIKKIMANYEKFSNGQYPLGIQKMVLPRSERAKMPNIDEKIEELNSLEENLLEETRLMKTLTKGEKKRFYKSGMSMGEYLKSLGKLNGKGGENGDADADEDTNGMVVEDEDAPQKKKKRKTLEQSENGEKQTKKKKKLEMETSIELDNGFEVEDSAVVEEEKEKEEVKKNNKDEKPKQKKKETTKNGGTFEVDNEWDKPLEEGEVEFFVTPTKQRLKHLNVELGDSPVNSPKSKIVKNPFATNGSPASQGKKQKKQQKNALTVPESPKTPVNKLSAAAVQQNTPLSSGKRVQIVLERNMAQEKSEYFQQLRNSPQIPFDSNKKPTKGLLKPNSMPSPINPFYKKKIGLKLDNE